MYIVTLLFGSDAPPTFVFGFSSYTALHSDICVECSCLVHVLKMCERHTQSAWWWTRVCVARTRGPSPSNRGSAVSAGVPAVSSSAGLISQRSSRVITETRPLAHLVWLMSYKWWWRKSSAGVLQIHNLHNSFCLEYIFISTDIFLKYSKCNISVV